MGRSSSRAACSRRARSADTVAGTPAEAAVRRVVEAISGRDEPGYETLSPDAKLLRAFDLAGVAISTLSQIRPIALFIDDVQWADDDTLRLLRYVVRSDAERPIFLFLTIRPDEFASVTEAVNFVADMERMGLVRRLRPGRFGAFETAELLKRVLGGPVEPHPRPRCTSSPRAFPSSSRSSPERTARPGRSSRSMASGGSAATRPGSCPPRSGRSSIDARRDSRRGHGPRWATPRSSAAASAFEIFGRSGRGSATVRSPPRMRTTDGPNDGADPLADDLEPAVHAGLLLPQPQGEPADYTFTHEQVRQFASSQLSAARRRQVHAAVVDLLLDGGDPAPAGLPMLAQHALAAGDTARAARFSIDAATAALASNAPEEALRLVEQALPVVVVAGRPAGPARDPRRRVRGPPPDGRPARRPDRAGRARRGDARSVDRARRPAPARVGAADEPRRGFRRGAGPSRPYPGGRARGRGTGAPGDPRTRSGAPAQPAGRVVRWRRARARPRRSRGGLSPRDRRSRSGWATSATLPPPSARSG